MLAFDATLASFSTFLSVICEMGKPLDFLHAFSYLYRVHYLLIKIEILNFLNKELKERERAGGERERERGERERDREKGTNVCSYSKNRKT